MPQPRALARYRIVPLITQRSITRHKDVPADSEQAFNVESDTATRVQRH